MWRKAQILCLISMGYDTSDKIAQKLGIPRTAVTSKLYYYFLQGLVKRVKVGREFKYALTPKGEKRIKYYLQHLKDLPETKRKRTVEMLKAIGVL